MGENERKRPNFSPTLGFGTGLQSCRLSRPAVVWSVKAVGGLGVGLWCFCLGDQERQSGHPPGPLQCLNRGLKHHPSPHQCPAWACRAVTVSHLLLLVSRGPQPRTGGVYPPISMRQPARKFQRGLMTTDESWKFWARRPRWAMVRRERNSGSSICSFWSSSEDGPEPYFHFYSTLW